MVGFQSASATVSSVAGYRPWAYSIALLRFIGPAEFTGYPYAQHALVTYPFETTDENTGAAITAAATVIPKPGPTATIFELVAVDFIGLRHLRERVARE